MRSVASVTGATLKLTFRRLRTLDPRNFRLLTRAAQDVFRPLGRATEAQAALDRALQISPNNDYAMTAKAELFQEQVRLEDAAKELQRIPNDSTDPYVLLIRATQALLQRNFDSAIDWTSEATKSLKPEQSLSDQAIYALVLQGYSQKWAGRSDEARETFDRLVRGMMPNAGFVIASGSETRSLLAMAYAGLADKPHALDEARQAVADNEKDAVIGPITEANRARVLAQIGEVDTTINTLPHLLQLPGGITPSDLRYSPFWDPLRKNPRFQELLRHAPSIRY
jgi:tetratricopeptide (TPR) repeat protein